MARATLPDARAKNTARAPLPDLPMLALLGAMTLVTLPYLLRLPPWFSLFPLALLGWRTLVVLRGWVQPTILILAGLAALLIGATVNAYGTLLGRDGGTAFLLGLLSLKLLESRTHRDALLMVLLGYFATTANFFFSQDISTALYTLLTLVALTGVLILWQSPDVRGRNSRRSSGHIKFSTLLASLLGPLKKSAPLLLSAVPLALLLFVLFPRPSGPLWTVPLPSNSAQTGLSSEMSPGSVSNLTKNADVVFRAQFEGATPAPQNLYWRGPVLESYNGITWKGGPFDLRVPTVNVSGPRFRYSLTLEPSANPWVLALDMPTVQPPLTRVSSRFEVLTRPQGGRRRFDLESSTTYQAGVDDYPERINAALELPLEGNPQTRALAQSWQNLPPLERVNAALKLFRTQNFSYTLNPPLLPQTDNIDAFLFGSRAGFCEHYAGAFTFLMRSVGVPARVVTGYQGGQRGADGSYLIVRQSDAHAWSEVWLEGGGWQRVDPTAAVSPSRITQGVALSVQGGENLPLVARAAGGFLQSLALRWDGLQNGWNDWIVGFDGAKQRRLLESLGIGEVGSVRYILLNLSAVILLLALLVFNLRRRNTGPTDPVQRLYAQFLGRLERTGLNQGEGETAQNFAHRASSQLPGKAEQIFEIAREYNALRYGTEVGTRESLERLKRFGRLVRGFRW